MPTPETEPSLSARTIAAHPELFKPAPAFDPSKPLHEHDPLDVPAGYRRDEIVAARRRRAEEDALARSVVPAPLLEAASRKALAAQQAAAISHQREVEEAEAREAARLVADAPLPPNPTVSQRADFEARVAQKRTELLAAQSPLSRRAIQSVGSPI